MVRGFETIQLRCVMHGGAKKIRNDRSVISKTVRLRQTKGVDQRLKN